MNIIVLDHVGTGAEAGIGSLGYFSRFAIRHLRERGHTVEIMAGIDVEKCAQADAVWCEWTNALAFNIASAHVCKRLILRMRGYDVWGPLHELDWSGVDALVYESPNLARMAREIYPGISSAVREYTISSGIDLTAFSPPAPRSKNIAMMARAEPWKGFQLTLEWARRRPDVHIHAAVAMLDVSQRFARWLRDNTPSNMTVYPDVMNIPAWLAEVRASYVLSASIWEDLGYSIVEGMAAGCKPLIHAFPNVRTLWPPDCIWRTLDDLDAVIAGPHEPDRYRAFVAAQFDEKVQSKLFADLIESIQPRATSYQEFVDSVITNIRTAVDAGRPQDVEQSVVEVRRMLDKHTEAAPVREALALNQAVAYFNQGATERARVWALRAMQHRPLPAATRLLAEVSWEAGAYEDARAWAALDPSNSARLAEMRAAEYAVPVRRADRVLHILVVQTAPRKNPTLPTLLAAFDRAGGWDGPKILAVDGRPRIPAAAASPEWRYVFASSTSECVGHARTMFTGLRAALEASKDDENAVITLLEDDALLSVNALKYIQSVEIAQITSWYSPLVNPYVNVKHGLFSVRSMKQFSRTVAVSFPRRVLLRASELFDTWTTPHGGDELFSALEEEHHAVHFPSIIGHDNSASTVGNVGAREAPTFDEDLDAFELLT